MTDREIVEKIIEKGDCVGNGVHCNECFLKEVCDDSHNEKKPCSYIAAQKWLKAHPEKYTYAEVDLPSWWDGRPIKGVGSYSVANNVYNGHCIGYDFVNKLYFIMTEYGEIKQTEYFEPITSTPTKVTIEKDGVKREIELTYEQVEALGL